MRVTLAVVVLCCFFAAITASPRAQPAKLDSFIRIASGPGRKFCLGIYGGLAGGLYYWTSDSSPQYNIQAGAPIGVGDCTYAEQQGDQRHLWKAEASPVVKGAIVLKSALVRAAEGRWPDLLLTSYDGGIIAGPVFQNISETGPFPDQSWFYDSTTGQLEHAVQRGQCLALKPTTDCPSPSTLVCDGNAKSWHDLSCCTCCPPTYCGPDGARVTLEPCTSVPKTGPRAAPTAGVVSTSTSWTLEPAQYSLILVADTHGPAGCGTNEAAPYLDIMAKDGPTYSHNAVASPFCQNVTTGTVFGHPVMLAVTGIGMMHATRCPEHLLAHFFFSRVIFSGTAGASAAVGGLASAQGCALRPAATAPPTHASGPLFLGDVCVSHIARNYDAMESSIWGYRDRVDRLGKGAMCDANVAFGPSDPSLMGSGSLDALGISAANSSNASDRVLAAAADAKGSFRPSVRVPVPRLTKATADALDAATHEFWRSASGRGVCSAKSTNCSLPSARTRVPRVFGYETCAEMSSYNYWSGVPEDDKSRNDTAQAINLVLRRSNKTSDKTRSTVVGFTSMEGVAWMGVLSNYNEAVRVWNSKEENRLNPAFPRLELPFTNVRGMSDYDHPPLCWDDSSATPRLTQCYEATEWHRNMSAGGRLSWECAGYDFAGRTAASVVLRMLEDLAHDEA